MSSLEFRIWDLEFLLSGCWILDRGSSYWLLQTEGTNVTFNEGSVNNGSTGFIQAQNYYAVPKDVVDIILKQQKALGTVLQKIADKT